MLDFSGSVNISGWPRSHSHTINAFTFTTLPPYRSPLQAGTGVKVVNFYSVVAVLSTMSGTAIINSGGAKYAILHLLIHSSSRRTTLSSDVHLSYVSTFPHSPIAKTCS